LSAASSPPTATTLWPSLPTPGSWIGAGRLAVDTTRRFPEGCRRTAAGGGVAAAVDVVAGARVTSCGLRRVAPHPSAARIARAAAPDKHPPRRAEQARIASDDGARTLTRS